MNTSNLSAAHYSGTSIGNEVFVLDNDQFKVYVFNLLTRTSQSFELSYVATDEIYSKYRKGTANVLPHNFQIVQAGAPAQVFMIGGGDFNNPKAKSHVECRKLLKQADKYVFQPRANMKHPRHGHSACAVGDRYIAVSGGRIGSGTTCEMFCINTNKWSDLPQMATKRHYHSSCSFGGKSVFVFCGIHNDTRSYINSIERLDVSMFH